ncbi:MAG: hypothetical protein ABW328_00040 [Ilumatobacteraceae bacterium]
MLDERGRAGATETTGDEVRTMRPDLLFPWDEGGAHEHRIASGDDAREYVRHHCVACGLRMVHLWLNSRTWVRRRVEHVEFIDDRTVRRRVSIDFTVPLYAPTVRMGDQVLHMIPIALLERRSLINFDLRDEAGTAVSILSDRQNDAITAAILKGIAMTSPEMAGDELDARIDGLIDVFAFGNKSDVRGAQQRFDREPGTSGLRNDTFFSMTLARLQAGWLMCLLLPHRPDLRRILKFAYDEPLAFSYEKSGSRSGEERRTSPPWWARLSSGIGLAPVRFRFITPGAESAQSYLFEVTAPPGTDIRSAAALAEAPGGRSQGDPSFDVKGGVRPRVNLHLEDVPTGWSAMTQVELAAQRQSWMSALTTSACIVSLLLLAIALALRRIPATASPSRPDVSLLVVFVSLASTLVLQQVPHAMLARLLRPARFLVGLSTVCALFLATRVALYPLESNRLWLWIPALVSVVPALLLLLGTWRLRTSAPPRTELDSPTDFTDLASDRAATGPHGAPRGVSLWRELGFDRPAIVVQGSESIRSQNDWTPGLAAAVNERLQAGMRRFEPEKTEEPDVPTTASS